jgi:hypothetical protein
LDADTLNQWLTLVANVGVLAGIIFLAVEVRQNSRNLAAQVRATFFSSVADTWRIPAESPELTEIMAKDSGGEELTQAELWQIQAFWTRVHMAMEWGYKELPRNEFVRGLPFQKTTYDIFPSYRSAWEEREGFFDQEFYRYMNAGVFLTERSKGHVADSSGVQD